MGIQPDEIEYGDDCLVCYDAGKTPKYLKVFLSGIKVGDWWHDGLSLPPNGYWNLEQDEDHPCIWNDAGPGGPVIIYKASPVFIYLHIIIAPDIFAFIGTSAIPCRVHFENKSDVPAGCVYWGGFAHICTTKYIVDKIAELTPMFDPDPRMELFAKADGHIVIRYAGKRDGTNISFEVDTFA